MERSLTGHMHSRHKHGAESSAIAEPDPSDRRHNRSTIRYGLVLLFVALSVGLAAALFLTVGTSHAGSALESLTERLDRHDVAP